jgi:hypothetical protein
MSVTWARFYCRDGSWHFAGFADGLAAVREFEDLCAGEGTPCVTLALSGPEPALAIEGARPPWRKTDKVPVAGELL